MYVCIVAFYILFGFGLVIHGFVSVWCVCVCVCVCVTVCVSFTCVFCSRRLSVNNEFFSQWTLLLKAYTKYWAFIR